jgi:hypothetical protein
MWRVDLEELEVWPVSPQEFLAMDATSPRAALLHWTREGAASYLDGERARRRRNLAYELGRLDNKDRERAEGTRPQDEKGAEGST